VTRAVDVGRIGVRQADLAVACVGEEFEASLHFGRAASELDADLAYLAEVVSSGAGLAGGVGTVVQHVR
jgi:hypothetical protein